MPVWVRFLPENYSFLSKGWPVSFELVQDYLKVVSNIMPRQEGWAYSSIYEIVLKEGKLCEAAGALSKDAAKILAGACGRRTFQLKQCFYNSQIAVLSDSTDEMEYWEGFAYAGTIPVYHGWIVLKGQVVDLTWRNRKGLSRLGVDPKDWVYFGSPIPKDLLLKRAVLSGELSCVLDDPENGWPLLKNGITKKEVCYARAA